MRFESDGKNFSANIDSFPETKRRSEFENAGVFLKENKALLFSVIAIAIAFANLALGLFINLGSKLLINVFESDNYHFIVLLIVFSVVMALISVTLGVVALAYYKKSKRELLDKIFAFVAILSFALSAASLTFDMLGLFVW